MGDQGDRKTVRAFQCRDYLFEIYDRMSAEHGCSVDYLINEAMREYARAREQTVAAIDAREALGSAAIGAAGGRATIASMSRAITWTRRRRGCIGRNDPCAPAVPCQSEPGQSVPARSSIAGRSG